MKTLKSLYLAVSLVCLINFAHAATLGTPEIIMLLVVCIFNGTNRIDRLVNRLSCKKEQQLNGQPHPRFHFLGLRL